jgi:hypothetical protein
MPASSRQAGRPHFRGQPRGTTSPTSTCRSWLPRVRLLGLESRTLARSRAKNDGAGRSRVLLGYARGVRPAGHEISRRHRRRHANGVGDSHRRAVARRVTALELPRNAPALVRGGISARAAFRRRGVLSVRAPFRGLGRVPRAALVLRARCEVRRGGALALPGAGGERPFQAPSTLGWGSASATR